MAELLRSGMVGLTGGSTTPACHTESSSTWSPRAWRGLLERA